MEITELSAAKPGLRERKKQQTRETIERAALKLFAERGYDQTTLADIAEAADISPRTIFGYFQSKEDILFCEESGYLGRLAEMLEQRPPGATTVDALREFLATIPHHDEQAMLRKQIINATPALQMRARAHLGQLEPLLLQSIAKDLDTGPDDIRPALIAASMTAAFSQVRDRLQAAPGEPDLDEVRRIFDQVLEFLQGGLQALQKN
jgi:AcrR family transcriptional regulator